MRMEEYTPTIRPITEADLDQVLELCALHAAYEKLPFQREDQRSRWQRDFFSPEPKLYGLVASVDQQLIGYATYMKQYATWDAGEYLYLDCLFVRETHRSLGIGELLMKQVIEDARRLRCEYIQWQTPTFNTRAMKFYRRMGAYSKSKERFFLNL